MKFSEEKLSKLNKIEIESFAQVLGVKYPAKASKDEIISILTGLSIVEPAKNKNYSVNEAPKAVAPKKRGRPSKAELAVRAKSEKKEEIKAIAPKKRGRPSKAELAVRANDENSFRKSREKQEIADMKALQKLVK